MGDISKNFSYAEFAVSATAAKKGIKITIPEALKPNIKALVINVLQRLCDARGWQDAINSGYRPKVVNDMVGGSPTSQHMTAEAADNMFYTRVDGKVKYVEPIDALRTLLNLNIDFDQAIIYPTFLHISYTTKRKNRRQVLYNKSYKGARA